MLQYNILIKLPEAYAPLGATSRGGKMDYFCFIQSVVSYVENRLDTDLDYDSLQTVTGFSLPHAREIFKVCTKMPLARYVLYRKVSHAAFEIIHTDKKILDIALDFGFESYDTFTRAFKRITGLIPSEFRKKSIPVGRIKLTAGIYGPGILDGTQVMPNPLPKMEEITSMKTVKKSEDSCILYGVPKVQYCGEGLTPFPSSLKACLNYMGQDISYTYLMAASGAAFRLRWNPAYWDGGNVGIEFIYENPNEAYERSFQAAGRALLIKNRRPETPKAEFCEFIKSEIDEGRPVIAIGVIGPPEACIITGYRDRGKVLLGWNFFQDIPEFAKDSQVDESGYFICQNWWENPHTQAVISIGETQNIDVNIKEILENAIDILTKERVGTMTGGPAAYDAWAKAILDESQFPKDAVLPLLFERLMCQGDAMDMIGEGRHHAAEFMEWVAKQAPEVSEKCVEAAKHFKDSAGVACKMGELLGGWQRGEAQALKLANPLVRKEIAVLIQTAKELEAKGCVCLKMIVALL
jgi:AraC-like DNA-binding protein